VSTARLILRIPVLADFEHRATFGWVHIVSYIDPGNTRSIALGLRLGGRLCDRPGIDPTDVVIEHDLRGRA
jgi:hypothetical protein